MARFSRKLALAAAGSFVLTGCSMSGLVDKMLTPDEKALAIGVAEGVCSDSLAQYRTRMTDEFRAHFDAGDIVRLKRYCSGDAPTSKVIGVQTQSSTVNGVSTRAKQINVLTKGAGRWTSSAIVLRANGDEPLRVNGITMSASAAKPGDTDFAEKWDNALPYIRIGAVLALLLLVGVIVAIVRYNRRLREKRGQG